MSAYRHCEPAAVVDSLRELQQQIQLKIVPADEIWTLLSDSKFLAADGTWWTIGPCSLQWYAYRGKVWTPVDEGPSGTLLGPTDRVGASAGQAGPPPPSGETGGPEDAAPPFIERYVADIRRRFEAGVLDSESAESLLCGHFLLDKNGRAWSVGWRSGDWYAFDDGGWLKQASPPRADDLVDPGTRPKFCSQCGQATDPQELACVECGRVIAIDWDGVSGAAAAAIQKFMGAGIGTAPECPLIEWDAPRTFPEMPPLPMLECARCGSVNLLDARVCCQCGRPPAAETSSSGAPMDAAVAPAVVDHTCHACGQALEAGTRFCTSCGARRD